MIVLITASGLLASRRGTLSISKIGAPWSGVNTMFGFCKQAVTAITQQASITKWHCRACINSMQLSCEAPTLTCTLQDTQLLPPMVPPPLQTLAAAN